MAVSPVQGFQPKGPPLNPQQASNILNFLSDLEHKDPDLTYKLVYSDTEMEVDRMDDKFRMSTELAKSVFGAFISLSPALGGGWNREMSSLPDLVYRMVESLTSEIKNGRCKVRDVFEKVPKADIALSNLQQKHYSNQEKQNQAHFITLARDRLKEFQTVLELQKSSPQALSEALELPQTVQQLVQHPEFSKALAPALQDLVSKIISEGPPKGYIPKGYIPLFMVETSLVQLNVLIKTLKEDKHIIMEALREKDPTHPALKPKPIIKNSLFPTDEDAIFRKLGVTLSADRHDPQTK